MKGRRHLLLLTLLALLLVPSPPHVFALPDVERFALDNGTVALVRGNYPLPFVTINLLVDGGARRDPPGKEGLAGLTARMLSMGTAKRSANKLSEELDAMGASLSVTAGREYAVASVRALSKDLDRVMDLLFDVLSNPLFPEEELKGEIAKTRAALQASEDDPGTVADRAFRQSLYLTPSYAHPVEGTLQSLAAITRRDVHRFFENFYVAEGSIVVIVGDLTIDALKERIVPRLLTLRRGLPVPGDSAPRQAVESREVRIDRDISQANIVLGKRGIVRSNPDYYAFSVMNYILGGGGLSSRLMEEVRNRRGLAYSVGSYLDAGKAPGSFQVVLQTKNASAREALAVVRKEIERMRSEPVTDKELESAKKYLTGSFPLRLDTQGKLAGFLLTVEYYGLGLDYADKYRSIIEAVTAEQILSVARRYLSEEGWIDIVVANLQKTLRETEGQGKTP